jgi:hypothetical protein
MVGSTKIIHGLNSLLLPAILISRSYLLKIRVTITLQTPPLYQIDGFQEVSPTEVSALFLYSFQPQARNIIAS